MPSNRATRRPSRAKQAWEKWEAIQRVEVGESKAAVARELDVPESTLRGWCKNREKILILAKQNPKPGTVIAAVAAAAVAAAAADEIVEHDESAPQNLSVRNTPPLPSSESEGAIDLSRTSPTISNSRAENNQMSNIANYLETARLFQVVQQAQMNLLSGGGLPVSSLPRNGVPNMPTDRLPNEETMRQWLNVSIPTQVSPNSSSATLSTPRNVQKTTSPLAAITPEQQSLYFDMYRTMLGNMNPFNISMTAAGIPLFNQQMMQKNFRGASATHPVSPNQSAKVATVSEKTQRSSPDMNSNNQMQKLEIPLTTPSQPTSTSTVHQYPSTSAQSYYPNTSLQSYPTSSVQYFNGNNPSATQNSNQLFIQCPSGSIAASNRDQLSDSNSSSTLDLSMKSGSIKNETESDVEDMDFVKTEIEPVESKPQLSKTETQIAEPALQIAMPVEKEDKPEVQQDKPEVQASAPAELVKQEPATEEKKTADQKERRTSRKRSLASVVKNLNFEGEQQEPGKRRKIEDCVLHGEAFLEALQDNAEQLRYTAFQLKTVQTLISTIKEFKEAEQN